VEDRVRKARDAFTKFASLPTERIPLAEAALLIAAEEYPFLDIGAYLARIDALADDIREEVDNAPGPVEAGDALARFLHDRESFRGDDSDYYDPRNSFLNEVLDRRRGIPITLSILYMEIARRLGLAVDGVGLPGHFVVRLVESGTYVDAFLGRANLKETDCVLLAEQTLGDRTPFDRTMLAPQSTKQILTRVLANLLAIYRARGDTERARSAIDRMLLLNPGESALHRQRARLLAGAGQYRAALRDIEQIATPDSGVRRGRRLRAWRRFVRDMAARMN
jgi:regulator of sirC expression with transglutaminase-like and TPR domain